MITSWMQIRDGKKLWECKSRVTPTYSIMSRKGLTILIRWAIEGMTRCPIGEGLRSSWVRVNWILTQKNTSVTILNHSKKLPCANMAHSHNNFRNKWLQNKNISIVRTKTVPITLRGLKAIRVIKIFGNNHLTWWGRRCMVTMWMIRESTTMLLRYWIELKIKSQEEPKIEGITLEKELINYQGTTVTRTWWTGHGTLLGKKKISRAL